FNLQPPDLPAIAKVVRELDGLPLAIELAASRMGILTVQQLQSRLPARFVLLADSKRNPSGPIERQERQRTLEGAIRWSWRLLAERDQLALARCSVFRGGFTLEAAEAVLGPEMPALDILQSLRDRSLLSSAEITELPGENRFSLLNSIREYADHRLSDMGDRALAQSRHTAFFLEHGQKLAAQLEERPDFKALRRLQLEADNLIAVLERALAVPEPTSGSVELSLRTLLSLDPVLQISGPFSRHLEWLDAALKVPVPGQPALWARALLCRAAVHRNEGHLGPSRRDYADALLLSRQTGDRLGEGRAHDGLGMLSVLFGQIPDARDHYDAALDLFRQAGARADEGIVLAHLGTLQRLGGEHARARESYERALAVLRESGDEHSQCKVLTSLSAVYTESGDAETGLALCQQALALAERTGDARAEDMARRHMGDVYMMAGNLEEAEAHYSRCLALMQQTANRRLESMVLGCLSVIRAEQGRYPESLELVTRTIQLFLDSGDRYHAGIFQSFRAGVLATLDRLDESTAAFADAERVLAEIGAHVSIREGELYRAFLDLALARQALRDGDRQKAATHRDEAMRKLASAEAVESSERAVSEASFAASSARARIAIRILRACPWPDLSGSNPGSTAGSSDHAPIEADADGAWFRLAPDAQPVSFARRKNLRRVFARLLELRLSEPGRPLPLQELLEVGWPGERVLPAAAANRVYVALATLRKMGLKAVLISTSSGFFLDPAVLFVVQRGEPKI
ncbi:MAG TPA: tetratricopeptide repeat protein, partial [Myxococcaceae bacterium]